MKLLIAMFDTNRIRSLFSIGIAVWVLLQLFSFQVNGQNTIKGYKIYKDLGYFEIVDKTTGSVWLKEVIANFICDGIEYKTNELITQSVDITEGKSTFGIGEKIIWRFSHPSEHLSFGLELISYANNNWQTINGWVENRGKKKINLDRICLLESDKGFHSGENWEKWRVLCGNNIDSLKWAGDCLADEGNTINARSIMGMWNSGSDVEAVIGYSIKHAWGNILLKKSQTGINLSANVKLDVDLRPKDKVYAEAVHINVGPVLGSMEELISATGKEVAARTDGESFSGWCSWYGFNPWKDNDITEDAVVDFAKTAEQKRDELPLQLMLLDDGYFTLPGDWTTIRPFFPNGMKYLAEEVSKRGLIPGIWVAPTYVHENSNIIREHPEWVDRFEDGSPKLSAINWGGKAHTFDISNPQVLQHIDSLFRIICSEWGYKYLKLDFNEEPTTNRYNREITSFEAMRNMYKVIRKAVGPEVFIANCAGTPYPPSIGIAQAGRVGWDVNPEWESVIQGCRQCLLHIPFHRRWWVNDPDCLNMRKIGSALTDKELQTHLTANFMGGGYILFSDSLSELPADRQRMLTQALPTYGEAAHPINYMKSPGAGIPNILNLPVEKNGEKYSIVSLFNWEENDLDIDLDFGQLGLLPDQAYHVFDFWTDTYKGIATNNIRIKSMEPHSCQLLAIKPLILGEIQIVSTNLHLLQGTMEITDIQRMNTSPMGLAKAEIWISIKPVSLRSGKLILAAAEGLRIAAIQGMKASLQKRNDGLWDLNVEKLQDKAAILLRIR
ncbi:MAG: alpha-galactosidase [Bacteroidia bacterium]|nr:alpha-galactosidase [Bacteroidia bacterium]